MLPNTMTNRPNEADCTRKDEIIALLSVFIYHSQSSPCNLLSFMGHNGIVIAVITTSVIE